MPSVDPTAIRAQFPGLLVERHGRPLAWLDNAATTAKPRVVLEALQTGYVEAFANVHRAVHGPAELATARYEAARARVARFLGSDDPDELVFVRGTTEALNLVVATVGQTRVGRGDEVVVSGFEHHASFVPWQRHCRSVGATLRVLPFDRDGVLQLDQLERLLGPRTRVVAVPHASNALGTLVPVREIARRAHAVGAIVVVDGAQAVPHLPVSVSALEADAYAFSGHKVYGPQGIGALWMRRELWASLPPWQTGGEMVLTVDLEETTFQPAPHGYEAGTPHVVGALALAVALDFVEGLGWEALAQRESGLARRARQGLAEIRGVRLVGPAVGVPLVSFVVDGVHPHDVGTLLDLEGIAVRTGHHCAMPAMTALGIDGTTRASFAAYNTEDEVDRLVAAVERAKARLG